MTQVEEIKNVLDRDESVQVIGLPGTGKSRYILRKISDVYLDARLLYPADYLRCLRTLSRLFGLDASDPVQIQQEILAKTKDKKVVIAIDGFETMQTKEFTPFFDFLKLLRDLSKHKVRFIFGVTGAYQISNTNNVLGNLNKIVNENVSYLQPISYPKFEKILKDDFADEPKADNPNFIYEQTGGIRSLVKIVLRSIATGKSIEPKDNPLLNAQLFEIAEVLGKKPTMELLKLHGLVDKKGKIISLLIKNYLDNHNGTELTVSETLLLNLFKLRPGEIVTKDEICTAVYPEVKNKGGISDNSIDQLIHRLRKKLSDYKIISLHGHGYKLLKI